MVVSGQRQTARLAAEQGVRYPSHVNTYRLRGGPSDGPARGNGRPAGRASADDCPPAVGPRHRHATWPHPVQAARDQQVPEPTILMQRLRPVTQPQACPQGQAAERWRGWGVAPGGAGWALAGCWEAPVGGRA